MNKLQKGDYVENLNEEEFNELMKLQADTYSIYDYGEDVKSLMLRGYGEFLFIGMVGTPYAKATNLLSFDEFKQRAINTFKQC